MKVQIGEPVEAFGERWTVAAIKDNGQLEMMRPTTLRSGEPSAIVLLAPPKFVSKVAASK